MIIKEVELKPSVKSDVAEVEAADGLKYAVMYDGKVVALFGAEYWADKFIRNTGQPCKFSIREVKE